MPRTPKEYSDSLSNQRNALARVAIGDLPALNSHNDTLLGTSTSIDARKTQIIEAFLHANGNPADGRWIFMVHLLRLGITRGGYKWSGARADEQEAQPRAEGWLNAKTEAEWSSWERTWCKDKNLRQRVESWKQTMSQDRRNPSLLAFKVAKRSALTNTSKPPTRNSPLTAGATKTERKSLKALNAESNLVANGNCTTVDSLFLPPSFSSQIATSTPRSAEYQKSSAVSRSSVPSPIQSPTGFDVHKKSRPNGVNSLDTSMVGHAAERQHSIKRAGGNARNTNQADLLLSHNAATLTSGPVATSPKHPVTVEITTELEPEKRHSPSYLHNVHHDSKERCNTDTANSARSPCKAVETDRSNVARGLGTQSLASLDQDEDDFNPPFTSTQRTKGNNIDVLSPRDSHQWLGSRFNINGKVDEAQRLLKEDLEHVGWCTET
ncbi:hypothetical protein AX17_001957 [Amanita inopinata Kibby_2008]|nr:hypothetical protein AX17_001957 [Amanita inopinata Kibby_2008]